MSEYIQFSNSENESENRMTTPPKNYMEWAILSTLFCCLPLRIVSIIKASEVNSKWVAGDYQGAIKSSQQAKNLAIWSVVSGIIIYLSWILCYWYLFFHL